MSTHTAIAATGKGRFGAVQLPTEEPGEGEVQLRVHYGSMVAFDTYVTDRGFYVEKYPAVLGFSGAGVISKIGLGVTDLQVGDRVTAYGLGLGKSKNLQEYSIQPWNVVAKIPDSLPFAEASTIPDNFITAFYTLFNQLGLPIPSTFPATSSPPLANTPILVYGTGSTSGIYAVQLLSLAGYKHIIAVASKRHHDYLRSLGATDTFDYSSPSLVKDIAQAVGGDGKILLAMDCITAESTLDILAKVMSPLGTLAILIPIKEGSAVTGSQEHEMYFDVKRDKHDFPKETKIVVVRTFNYQDDEQLKRELMPRILPELLQKGLIKPSRIVLLDQGTLEERVGTGLALLRENKVSGEKVVVKIDA